MSSDKKIANFIKNEIEGVTPGVCVSAYVNGKKKLDVEVGRVYKYYDIASLTKVVFSMTELMRLFDAKKFNEHDMLKKYLSWYSFEQVKIKNLLCHNAGLTWWKPYFKTLAGEIPSTKDLTHTLTEEERLLRWQKLKTFLREEAPQSVKQSTYSDLDFLLLGMLIEELNSSKLIDVWSRLSENMELTNTHFNLYNKPKYKTEDYAPTEDCLWRKRVIQGEVHDENTWSLAGVSSHAGLFSNMQDLQKWSLGFRNSIVGEKKWVVTNATIKHFIMRQVFPPNGDWALGFMMPTQGSASCGTYFSKNSVGHTGFTGMSIWFDPDIDLLVIIASNRVHPTRENKRFLELRPKIHNWIYEELIGA